jgi:hypothetical protein
MALLTKHHGFDLMQIGYQKMVSDEVLKGLAPNATVEVTQDILGGMIYSLRAWVLKSEQKETKYVSVEYPATWFDHFKDYYLKSGNRFMKWLVSKLAPPKMQYKSKTVETLIRICPHADYAWTPDQVQAKHVDFLEWRLTDGDPTPHPDSNIFPPSRLNFEKNK